MLRLQTVLVFLAAWVAETKALQHRKCFILKAWTAHSIFNKSLLQISLPKAQKTQDAACTELLFLGKSGFSQTLARGILTGGALISTISAAAVLGGDDSCKGQEYLQETSHLTMSEKVNFPLSSYSFWNECNDSHAEILENRKITHRAAVEGHCEIWTYRVPVTEVTPMPPVQWSPHPPSAWIVFLQCDPCSEFTHRVTDLWITNLTRYWWHLFKPRHPGSCHLA